MCHPAHLSSFGASQRHAGMQPGLGTQPCRPHRTAPGTAQPGTAPTPGCWCWCDWCNQNWPVMPGPFPCVHPREHSPVTLQAASLRPRQGRGDLRVNPIICRAACTSLCHSACRAAVPVSPRQHRWDFGLGLRRGVGNIELLWFWARGIKWELGMDFGAQQGWDGTS